MKLLGFLRNHNHYWGVPHPRATDNQLVQTCYECGAEREIKIELRQSEKIINYPDRDGGLAA